MDLAEARSSFPEIQNTAEWNLIELPGSINDISSEERRTQIEANNQKWLERRGINAQK